MPRSHLLHTASSALLVLSLSACSGTPEPSGSARPDVAERRDAFTVGVERIIPIRAVLVRAANDGSTPARTNYSSADVRERVARMLTYTNEIWRATGVRFTVGSIDQIVDPVFANNANTGGGSEVAWSPALRLQLEHLLPGTTTWASVPAMGTPHTLADWMHAAVLRFGRPDSFYAFFSMESPSGGCDSWQRSCFFAGSGNELGDNPHLAHELGHAFDLGEVGWLGREPRTNAVQTTTDMWDMFYCPGVGSGAPNRYYSS